MTTVFLAGSISIENLHRKVEEQIKNIVSSDFKAVVGDAAGADTAIQMCLQKHYAKNVTVYCAGEEPRTNLADWPVRRIYTKARLGTRAYFTAKDLEMARDSDFGLMVWDCKSTGTLSNVLELLRNQKKSVVFINKIKDFLTVSDDSDLTHLLTFMSTHARAKAEEKIGLSVMLPNILPKISSSTKTTHKEILPAQMVGHGFKEEVDDGAVRNRKVELRRVLMRALKQHFSRAQLTETDAAKLYGVEQSQIMDLIQDRVDAFQLEMLIDMATAGGLHVEIQVQEN